MVNTFTSSPLVFQRVPHSPVPFFRFFASFSSNCYTLSQLTDSLNKLVVLPIHLKIDNMVTNNKNLDELFKN